METSMRVPPKGQTFLKLKLGRTHAIIWLCVAMSWVVTMSVLELPHKLFVHVNSGIESSGKKIEEHVHIYSQMLCRCFLGGTLYAPITASCYMLHSCSPTSSASRSLQQPNKPVKPRCWRSCMHGSAESTVRSLNPNVPRQLMFADIKLHMQETFRRSLKGSKAEERFFLFVGIEADQPGLACRVPAFVRESHVIFRLCRIAWLFLLHH